MKNEQRLTLAKVSNKTKTTVFYLLFAFCGLMVIGGTAVAISDKDDILFSAFMITLFILLSLLCYLKILKLKAIRNAFDNCKDYISRLSADREKSIEKLADDVHKPYKTVEFELSVLLKLGIIEDAYIDEKRRVLVVSEYSLYDKIPDVEKVSVKCANCGGTTTIEKNTAGLCEYCGAAISDS